MGERLYRRPTRLARRNAMPMRYAPWRESRLRPSYASNRPNLRHSSSRSPAGALGSATRSTKAERLCSTHGKSGTAYAGAMFAVERVRQDGRWLVSGIDTFGR